jgi:hypothetical protein
MSTEEQRSNLAEGMFPMSCSPAAAGSGKPPC